MRARLILLFAAALGSGALVAANPAAASSQATSAGYIPANILVAQAVADFQSTHADGDYVGLNDAIVAAGGDPVKFDFPSAGLYGPRAGAGRG